MKEKIKCAWCKKSINSGNYISGASQIFCSDVCLLRFYKEELPNLVGHVITDEDIQEIEQSTGEKRRELYEKISSRMMEGIDSSKIMQAIKRKAERKKFKE